MKKKNIFIFLICFGCLFLWQTIAIGESKSSLPQRIISLGPSMTINIYLLGAQDKLIADTIYCTHPKDAEKKIKIGNLAEMDLEKVYKLKPDLVLVTPMADQKQIKKLKNLGIKVQLFQYARSYQDLCDQLLLLGKLIGRQKEAKQIINKQWSKIKAIQEKIKSENKPKVFLQIGVNPLFTINKDSFINDYINFAGGINIAKDAHSGIYSREQVVKANPDIILITTMGIEGNKEQSIWKEYKTINAVRNNNIYILDEYHVCSPSVISFVDTLKVIKGIIDNVK